MFISQNRDPMFDQRMWWHKDLKHQNQIHIFHFQINRRKKSENWNPRVLFTSILLLPLMEASDAAIFVLARIVRRERDEEEAPKFFKIIQKFENQNSVWICKRRYSKKCALDIRIYILDTCARIGEELKERKEEGLGFRRLLHCCRGAKRR